MTKPSFDETLIEVWRQALVENAKVVKVGVESYPVRRTPKLGLREVDFTFDGDEIRGLEQNPDTKSRWAEMARSGKKVMQFLSKGRYVANVVAFRKMRLACVKPMPPRLICARLQRPVRHVREVRVSGLRSA